MLNECNVFIRVFCLQQEKLVAILFGLLRLGKLQFLDQYREETFTAMKAIVKQVICLEVAIPAQSNLVCKSKKMDYMVVGMEPEIVLGHTL